MNMPAATTTSATEPAVAAAGPCMSCGSPQARTWSTREGKARLCPPCATLHGLGCP